jgi:TrmH family RNA methyltransferase
VDLWSPKVLRAGVGGHFRARLITGFHEVEQLDRVGLVPLALAAGGIAMTKVDISDPDPIAFIVGNEAHGMPSELHDRITTVSLPMPGGTESLNAGVAASIAMYLRMSRRRDGDLPGPAS